MKNYRGLLFIVVLVAFFVPMVVAVQVNNPYSYNSLEIFPTGIQNVSNETVNDTEFCGGILCNLLLRRDGGNLVIGNMNWGGFNLSNVNDIDASEITAVNFTATGFFIGNGSQLDVNNSIFCGGILCSSYLRLDGTNAPMLGSVDWGGFNITNLGTVEIRGTNPILTFNDTDATQDWTLDLNANDLTISPTTPANGVLTLDSEVNVFPSLTGIGPAMRFDSTHTLSGALPISQLIFDESTVTLSGSFLSFWSMIQSSAIIEGTTNAALGNNIQLFGTGITSKSTTAGINPPNLNILNSLANIVADGATTGSTSNHFMVNDQVTFATINGGDLAFNQYFTVRSKPDTAISAGTTFDADIVGGMLIEDLDVASGTGTRTVINQIGIKIEDLTVGTNKYGILSEMDSGFFLNHSGLAVSNFGGDVIIKADDTRLGIGALGVADSYIDFDDTDMNIFSANHVNFLSPIFMDSGVPIHFGSTLTSITDFQGTSLLYNVSNLGTHVFQMDNIAISTLSDKLWTFNNGAVDTFFKFGTSGLLEFGVGSDSVLNITSSNVTMSGDLIIDGVLNATTYLFKNGGNITSNGTCIITTSPDGSTVQNICDV